MPLRRTVSGTSIARMRLSLTRTGFLGVLALAAAAACEKPAPAPTAEIVDLSTSLEALRRDFDAHRGEARFVTLLAPT